MELNWKKCIICQKDTSEPLKCPLDSRDPSSKTDAYPSFLVNVQQFRDINALPTSICFGNNVTASDFETNSASWHKSCHLKFNNTKLNRARKRSISQEIECPRRPSKRRQINISDCLFCEKGQEEGDLHLVSTFDADEKIRSMITDLQDAELLARIEGGGDLIARDAKYHLKCLVSLRNRYRSCTRKTLLELETTSEKLNESRAFVELANYIERSVYSGTLLFRLSELHMLYVSRLEDLGITKTVNKTRLKVQLLEQFPEAQEQFDGRNVVIIFKQGMESMLRDALKKRDFSEDVVVLAKAATIIRDDIFNHEGFKFTGSFPPGCQEDSLPLSLKSLISLIISGTNLKDQDKRESQPCLTISQLLYYNIKKKPSDSSVKMRHTLLREPPIPIYIGLNIHQLTRSKKLVQQLYRMGICISYDRVMEIEEWIATSTCEQFITDGVVSPACLRKGVFTVGALDNLDHNPSATTSLSSFHGTGISLFQLPTKENPGEARPPVTIPPLPGARRHSLPHNYAFVPAVSLKTTQVHVQKLDTRGNPDEGRSAPLQHTPASLAPTDDSMSTTADSIGPTSVLLNEAKAKEGSWIKHSLALVEKEELAKDDAIAWAACHALQQAQSEDPPALCALLPLFYEKAATPAMIKHGMDIQRQAIEYLNPGQIPVTTFDQPLFALAKYIQWKWPDVYGESVHVVMLGGLHTEMALWNTLGDILDNSGWTTALIEAEVASSGTADSFLKVSHLTRTRHAHQLTLLTLHKLQQEAFAQCEDSVSADDWRKGMLERSPTFMFWDLIIRYETLILIFIRAHREKNFSLYVEVLEKLTPLFFALDHVNYSRWMPVHVRDMKSLPDPIKQEFEKQGHWVLSKTNNLFSSIPFDQAHEQENAYIKSSAGCIGLTENPIAFRRWMLSGPELIRLQKQFETEYFPDDDPDNPKYFRNHEQGFAMQKAFQKQVKSLFQAFKKMGNPFLDDFPELIKLDSRDCVDESVVRALRVLEDTGIQQYHDFVKNVLEDRTRPIQNPIKKNSLALFKRPQPKVISKAGKKIKVLQNNVALFGQLYISMQSRDGDLKEFFAHEIQSFPPSLSDFGKLHLPNTKCDILHCLAPAEQLEPPSDSDCIVLDGAVIVHLLPTDEASTFNEYADKVFIPYLSKQLEHTSRIDTVWDTYQSDSLKESTREKRGKGVRRKVSGHAKLPRNWMDFLRDPNNKSELFALLTTKVANFNFPSNKAVYVTSGQSVISTTSNAMPNCNHEEADTRIVVHVLHALRQGLKSVKVRTVDTDVIVILTGAFFKISQAQPLADIWVAFGMGKNYRFYSINAIYSNLGRPKSQALPVFHSLTGCDTTSSFKGKGKKSAWQAWQAYEEATETLRHLANQPFQHLDLDSDHFKKIERLIVVLYDRTSPLTSVNETREELFCRKSRSVERIPPTQNALLQHFQRAVYQAGIWTTCTNSQQVVPSPQAFGWTKESTSWTPVWITLPEVSKACSQLIKCSCKGNCSNCKCGKANLICSPLCNCKCNE